MRLKIRPLQIKTGKFIVFLHEKDATLLGAHSGDRVKVHEGKSQSIGIVNIIDSFIKPGQVALSQEIISSMGIDYLGNVEISLAGAPSSEIILQRKTPNKKYTQKDLNYIIKDIVDNALTEAEIAYFIAGVYHYGLSMEETVRLTKAIFNTGQHLTWKTNKVADKHSIGGIAGNRTTPIVVSICASAGILMPKTSSRSITAAAGTADVIEAIAKVDFPVKDLKKIVEKTGACLVWGGSLGLAPADDKLIQVEKMLNLDPEPQLLASILAKKMAVGSKYVVIDIPCGDCAKIACVHAGSLKNKFSKIGKMLRLKINALITNGSEPIGNGVGPMLEIRDILRVLKQENSPADLENKSLLIAGSILEMMHKAAKGKGTQKAKEILMSGSAFAKFEEIISAQQGSISRLRFSKMTYVITSPKSGRITSINNKYINSLAKIAGSPMDKAAGLYLHYHVGDVVKKGSHLITIYSETSSKLKSAIDFYNKNNPISFN